ncbi:MAG: hypothetical protein SNJ64_01695 [Endomicrobiia bacterium]
MDCRWSLPRAKIRGGDEHGFHRRNVGGMTLFCICHSCPVSLRGINCSRSPQVVFSSVFYGFLLSQK